MCMHTHYSVIPARYYVHIRNNQVNIGLRSQLKITALSLAFKITRIRNGPFHL